MTNNKNNKNYYHAQIPCDIKQVKLLRDVVKEFIIDCQFSEEDLSNIELITDEALTNAITHGSYGKQNMFVEITLEITSAEFIMVIKDYGGKSFNPDYFQKIAERKTWGKGGRGIFLMKKIMNQVSFLISPNESTTLYLAKKLPTSK